MIHKKIGAFIFQDVQNPNETKTTAVTLRLYALILSVYFLVLFCVYCFLRDVPCSCAKFLSQLLIIFDTNFPKIFSEFNTRNGGIFALRFFDI